MSRSSLVLSGIAMEEKDMTCVKSLRKLGCGLSALAWVGSVGCSSDSGGNNAATSGGSGGGSAKTMLSCAISRCPNEPMAFDSEDQCDVIWNGPCAKEYKAYQKCYLDNEQCDADGQATLESTSPTCDPLTNALGDCVTAHE